MTRELATLPPHRAHAASWPWHWAHWTCIAEEAGAIEGLGPAHDLPLEARPRPDAPLLEDLRGRAPFHASATRDEVQDFEVDIEGLMDGIGLAAGVAARELGEPNAGRSDDLDALAAFVLGGTRVPRAPRLDEAAAARGRELFMQAGCATCHGAPPFTSSGLPGSPGTLAPDGELEVHAALRDVGTRNPGDVLRASGFDVPTLLGLHATAPYLHDGSATTLERVLANPRHVALPLGARETADLVAFLDSLDGDAAPVLP